MADHNTRIRPIETRYAGCHFRSRLEARWAVFFDTSRITWEYEPERFALIQTLEENQRCINPSYLPDFYLPEFDTWVEVKGSKSGMDGRYLDRVCGSYDYSLLPGMEDSQGSTSGLVILGPLPDMSKVRGPWCHPIVQKYKGLVVNSLFFGNAGPKIDVALSHHPKGIDWGVPSPWKDCTSVTDLIKVDGVPEGCAPWGDSPLFPSPKPGIWVNQCYSAARSSRFEHGQEGASL